MKSVYLAGPISGLSYDGATSWRDYAEASLADDGILGLSPMRGKEFLSHIESFSSSCATEGAFSAMSTPRGIMTRDRNDATKCDVLLVNLLGATKISVGTVMEIAWADNVRTPIVCVMEPGNIHEHAMVEEAIGYRVSTLSEALSIVKAILGVKPGRARNTPPSFGAPITITAPIDIGEAVPLRIPGDPMDTIISIGRGHYDA